MADIAPFRGWRYNPHKITDIGKKFSPLFDVVNARQLEELYRIPNNSIFISVPRSQEEATEKLQHWKRETVLVQDALPSIYVYYQYFRLYGEARQYIRKGFVCMIRMKEGEEDDIILHEDTIQSSVNDRIELLEKTQLNVAPTHGLYEDSLLELEPMLDAYMENPLYEYIDYQGIINKLAIIQQPEHLQKLIDWMRDKKVYLADGHHRLESSKVFRDRRKAEGKWSPSSIANYHLMYLTNLSSDDLRILPTHRIWKPSYPVNMSESIARIAEYFDFEDVSHSRKPIYDQLGSTPYTFGLITPRHCWKISLKKQYIPEKHIERPIPDVLKQLDYTVLHYFIFEKSLCIPYEKQSLSDEIAYEKDYAAALKAVAEEKATLAFIAKEVSIQQMLEICKTGYKMPQKSTYFYPKVVCGLVFGSIDEDENNSPFDTWFSVAP